MSDIAAVGVGLHWNIVKPLPVAVTAVEADHHANGEAAEGK